LVVLPVQDLAKQVFQVFQTYCKNTNVKVALATGQGQLDDEQQKIIKKGEKTFIAQIVKYDHKIFFLSIQIKPATSVP
jgi:superfamily II DNA/RNA helicase